MRPLVVTARLLEGFVVRGPIHLDALLSAAYAAREGMLLPPARLADCVAIPLPLERSACGRFWLCSVGEYTSRADELRHKNSRAPWVEYARFGTTKIRRVALSTGENKSYRVPYEFTIPEGGEIDWYCIGDAGQVRELLLVLHYLGKYRGSGKGRVAEWTVAECEPWGDGFPTMRDGCPLRNIPVEEGAHGALLRCDPPYWLKEGRVPCLAP